MAQQNSLSSTVPHQQSIDELAKHFAATTQQDLDKLAERLDKVDPFTSQRLRRLSEAIDGGPLAEPWAANDIHRLIDVDTVVELARSQGTAGRVVGILEWIRNFLIVAPLMFTWLSISQATAQYYTLVQSDKTQAYRPFLFLWEGGFGGHLPWVLTLSNLALGDFILLSLILVLTTVVSWQSHSTDIRKEQRAEKLRSELADVLARAALYFSTRQPNDFAGVITRLDQVIQQIMARFDTMTQKLDQTTQQFINELQEERRQRGDLDSFLQALSTISERMLNAASTIQHTSNQLTDSLNDLAIPVREIPLQQRELIQITNTTITLLNTAVNALQQLVREQETMIQSLHTTLTHSLRQIFEEEKHSHQKIFEEQTGFHRAFYDLMNNTLAQMITKQGQWGNKLIETVETLNTTLSHIGQLALLQEQSVNQQERFATMLKNGQEAQLDLTGQMRDTSIQMQEALKALQMLTPEARSMAEVGV